MRTTTLALAIASAGLAVLTLATPALAGAPAVDPSTLNPPPPPGAECTATGDAVRCATTFDNSYVGPAWEASCGLIYESRDDVRRGIRWYQHGQLTRRFVFQDGSGVLSLSPSFDGPAVTWTARESWVNDDIDPSQPEDSWPTTHRGLQLRLVGPDGTVIFQYAGHDTPDGTHTGSGDPAFFDSPEADAALCAALAG